MFNQEGLPQLQVSIILLKKLKTIFEMPSLI
jgi:hypothetical protein